MVQILPAPTSLGAEVGQSLGQGIQRGAEQGHQRGQVQNALSGLGNLPKNASAFDLAKELISATAGIPGAERYVGTLFPMLLAQMRGQQAGLPGSQVAAGNEQMPQGSTEQGPEGSGVVGAGGQFPRQGGYLTPPMNAEETNAFAQKYSLGDPAKLAEGYEIAQIQNQAAEKALQDVESRAKSLGVTEKEMPYFLQMAQKSNEKNPQKLIPDTMRNLESIRSLDNALVPGLTRGLAKKGTLGLVPALLAGGEDRETAIRRLKPKIDHLINKGYEPIVRDKLAKIDLSRTEIEDLIHPMTPLMSSKIRFLPDSSKDTSKNEKVLSEFMRKNVTPDTSLLVLRDKLWKEKGYDWKQINTAFQKSLDQGLAINNSQAAELEEFGTQPPRQSLVDIFADWGRPFDYIRGRK